MHWIFPKPVSSDLTNPLEEALGIHPSIALLLVKFGVDNVEKAVSLLHPKLSSLADPFLLPDMDRAVSRIFKAIDLGEQILLYGDYDVDGVTSVTLLHRVLVEFGGKVRSFLPNRLRSGYGLSKKGLEESFEAGKPNLLITLDCGTSSKQEIADVYAMGIEVIVIDHHECTAELPECVAIVNPKRGADFEYLCTVGIAFKVAHALAKTRREVPLALKDYLDLVALGTIADVVPLIAENRLFVIKGLEQAAYSKWAGLRALSRVAGLSQTLRGPDVSFKIAPRINAAGRLESAGIALELMLSSDEITVQRLVEQLEQLNTRRRELAELVFQQAETAVAAQYDAKEHKAIVVGGKNWHPGLIGIVAAKMVQKYHCPVIVIGFDAEGIGKGSARGVEGFSLVDALRHCDSYLLKHGGHHLAAGVSLEESKMAEFQKAFGEYAIKAFSEISSEREVAPDIHLELRDVTMHLVEGYEAVGPFGTNHPEPLFLLTKVQAATPPAIIKEKHRSFTFRQNGITARAIWFNSAEEPLPAPPWDVAFTLGRNDFRGTSSPSIYVQHLRSAAEASE